MDIEDGAKEWTPIVKSASEVSLKQLQHYHHIVMLMSCYGEGQPTDSARSLYDEMASTTNTESKVWDGLKYAVFGLGNSVCFPDRYNVVGKFFDAHLQQLGAHQMAPLGLGDDGGDIEQDFQDWKTMLLEKLNGEAAVASTGAERSEISASVERQMEEETPKQPQHERFSSRQLAVMPSTASLQNATVQSSTQLFKQFTAFDSCVELVLRGDALPYTTGDHVGIFPVNAEEVVSELHEALLQTCETDALETDASGAPLPHALKYQLDIGAVASLPLVKLLHRTAKEQSLPFTQQSLLAELSTTEGYTHEVKRAGLRLFDLLDIARGIRLDATTTNRMLGAIPALVPRYYSVSTAALPEWENEVHLVCRLVRYKNSRGRIVSGAASSYIHSLKAGDHVYCFTRPSTFRLPEDPKVPVIMVAAGTGISPFAAFLQHRQHIIDTKGRDAVGKSVLLYGCRKPEEQMFQLPLLQALESGALSSLHSEYSISVPEGSGRRPRFVHEAILEFQQQIRDMITEGAHVYVCGGASGFGQAVRRAFMQTLAVEGMTETQAAAALLRTGRYFEDLAD